MHQVLTRGVQLTLAALSILLIAVTPAAAAWYAKFDGIDGSSEFMVVVDRTGGGNPRLTLGIAGLLPFVEQNAVFRSIDCEGTPRASNRVFRLSLMPDENGQVFLRQRLGASIDVDAIKSVWISRPGGGPPACSLSINFTKIEYVVDNDGDGALGFLMLDKATPLLIVAVEKLMNDRARVNIIFNGQDGNDEVTVRGANRECGSRPTRSHFMVHFANVLDTPYKSVTVDMTQNELDSLRSLRVVNHSDGTRECAPLGIIAVLIGL